MNIHDFPCMESFAGAPSQNAQLWLMQWDTRRLVCNWTYTQTLFHLGQHLAAEAKIWFQNSCNNFASWQAFSQAWLSRFGETQATIDARLQASQQQDGQSVKRFIDIMRALFHKISIPMPLHHKMFVSRLTEPLRKQVKLCRPRTLDEAMQLAVQIEDEQLEIAMETQSPHEQMTHTIPVPSTVQIKNGLADPLAQGNVKAPAAARQRARYGKQPVVYGAREQEVPRYGHHRSSASMQAAGAPKNAGMLEAYLSSYLKSYVADRTPSTPEAIAYAARCQGNTETSHSTQRSRRSAEDRSSPHAAHKQAVNAYDTAGFGRAQSGWQAPQEQSGTSDYGAD